MEYKFIEYTIKELIQLIDNDKINLNPSYQRNFIWSSKDQNLLIDTILRIFPLPNFFIYKTAENKYEMVDGQQRTKTIYSFCKGLIKSSKKTGAVYFKDVNQVDFLNYKLPIILITELHSGDSLNEFYVLINKSGVHLNLSEVNKSEYHDKNFMKLANSVLSNQSFIDLNLFTDKLAKRMNDRAFVEELLGYLTSGIKEKKKSVELNYKDDITDQDYLILEKRFNQIIEKIGKLNEISPINKTRYKQKNDFYTLFNFIDQNLDLSQETLNYQYKILLILDGEDKDSRQIIRPSNKECETLRQYADYCVSQSNSKEARVGRLSIFNNLLKNTNELYEIKKIVEQNSKETFNSCLLNLYHNGNEGMGWHADNEKELKKNGTIASVSFGAARKIVFKHKQTGTKTSVLLENGSLLLMKDETQQYWLHSIPVSSKIKTPRINLTFRTIEK